MTIVIPAQSGNGLQVDSATPSYPWFDLEGLIVHDFAGGDAPTVGTFIGTNRGFAYSINDRLDAYFHIPHDYVPNSELFLHVHWSHNGTAISGNIVFRNSITYAKGHNQQVFPTSKVLDVTYNTVDIATTPRYIHRIDEIQCTVAGGDATRLDTAQVEVDGIIMVSLVMNTTPTITGGSPNDPYIFYVDLHYQSTNIGTKNKAPNFYG